MEKARLEKLQTITKEKQRALLERINNQQELRFMEIEGVKIVCLPKVFYPHKDTILLAKSAVIGSEDVVLEPCSGSGFISIYIAPKAKKVHATDINEHAVENIKENVLLNKLSSKVEVFLCDLFPESNIHYDVIVINPPYTDSKAKSIIEKCVWDEHHATVIRFFKEAKNHLKKDGKIYLAWSNFADFNFIESLAQEQGYTLRTIASTEDDLGEGEIIVFTVYEMRMIG